MKRKRNWNKGKEKRNKEKEKWNKEKEKWNKEKQKENKEKWSYECTHIKRRWTDDTALKFCRSADQLMLCAE